MQLQLSLNEVTLKSAKALRALNFPAGSDVENGKNICWLEAYGLPGLQNLCEEIKGRSHKKINHDSLEIRIIEDTVHFSGCNQSGFLLAQSAADFAENGKVVHVQNCRYPLLFFAEISRRTHLNTGFMIQWHEGDKLNIGSSISGHITLDINSENVFFAEKLKINFIEEKKLKKPQMMGAKWETSLKLGISVKVKEWELVCLTANRLLVPDNEYSHTSAGAEVDDSS